MSELYSNYLPNLERIRGPETPLEQLEKQVRFRTLSDHFKFDTEKWERPSFHNETHISSTWHGIDSLFRTYNNDENARVLPEYLNPKVQLERYNQMIAMKYLHLRNPEQMMIREDELESLMKIVFDVHDTGNIKRASGNTLVDLDKYRGITSEDNTPYRAEDRSKQNARVYLAEHRGISDADMKRYFEFIDHVTDLTQFIYDGSEVHKQNMPFGVLTRFIDVIAQGVHNKEFLMAQVSGLMTEQSDEEDIDGKELVFTPSNTYGFLWKYIDELVPEENRYEIIEALVGTPVPVKPRFNPLTYQEMKRPQWVSLLSTIPKSQLQNFIVAS